MGGCAILSCKSRSAKGSKIRFFRFPKNEFVAAEWLRYCRPTTTIKTGRVCSNHFKPSDYIGSQNCSSIPTRQLKPDAVPTQHTNDSQSNSEVKGTRSPTEIMAGSSKFIDKSNENVTIPLDEYKLLLKTAYKFNVLKDNLNKIFTAGQIRCLMTATKGNVKWSTEDMSAALSLRRNISPKAYRYLRTTVGIPLPAFTTIRKWASRYR